MGKLNLTKKELIPIIAAFFMMIWSTWVFINQLNIQAYDWRFYASMTSMLAFNIMGILAIYYFIKNYKNT